METSRLIETAGLDSDTVSRWHEASRACPLLASGEANTLELDAETAGPVFALGWELLDALPRRSQRDDRERLAASAVRESLSELCWRFTRAHGTEMYDRITERRTKPVRVDELVFRAAELWPGLVPSRAELEHEAGRFQRDKDGREIQQGLFVSQILSHRATGTHLILSSLEPTVEARERLDELRKTSRVDLGTARVEVRGKAGYVFFRHPRYLNAEDDETRGPLEVAIDLVLLHPELRIGVLRGDPVDHPKYRGRRIFSSGLNLTRLYQGKISFLFYLMRDLGLVHKLYRGLNQPRGESFTFDEPESTVEIPWIAVVEAFAIGGGCQLLLVVDYVIAEEGAYFNLPARKEGIIPGAANLRLSRFVGERFARGAILFDRSFRMDDPEAKLLVSEVHPSNELDAAVERAVSNAVGSGVVSAAANRKALRVGAEPLETFRRYMATYAREQACCHLSEQLIENLETHWDAKRRSAAD